jgi:hypothetical protein
MWNLKVWRYGFLSICVFYDNIKIESTYAGTYSVFIGNWYLGEQSW